MKVSHELRILANELEEIDHIKENLKAKEVWDKVNEVHIKIIRILEEERLFTDL